MKTPKQILISYILTITAAIALLAICAFVASLTFAIMIQGV